MKVLQIDHVQLAMPAGGEDRARSFYGDALGMEEIPKPQALAGRGGCWFASGAAQVHLGIEEDFRPAKKAHPALVVKGLAEILAKCKAAGLPARPDVEIDGRKRVHIWDPFGNRLELIEAKSV